MTDKELLMAAAQAYWGDEIDDVVSVEWSEQDNAVLYTHGDNQDHNGCDRTFCWNPKEQDHDAFGLAVRLSLSIMYGVFGIVQVSADDGGESCTAFAMEPLGDDAAAATRLAITRAAAEIDKARAAASGAAQGDDQ